MLLRFSCINTFDFFLLLSPFILKVAFIMPQVDADYKLQDTKKLRKEWEMKVKTLKKRLDDVQTNIVKHMEQ